MGSSAAAITVASFQHCCQSHQFPASRELPCLHSSFQLFVLAVVHWLGSHSCLGELFRDSHAYFCMEIFWTKCLTQEVGSCFPHSSTFCVSLLYCVQGLWLGGLCSLSVLLVVLSSGSSQHPFRSQGRPWNAVASTQIFSVLGKCSGRGLVEEHCKIPRWGYFPPSPGKKERNQKWVQVSRARQPLLPVPVREAPPRSPDAELHWWLFPSPCSLKMSDGLSALSLMVLLWQCTPRTQSFWRASHIYGDRAGLPDSHSTEEWVVYDELAPDF